LTAAVSQLPWGQAYTFAAAIDNWDDSGGAENPWKKISLQRNKAALTH
jgi:hypothetical protein